MGNSGDDLKLRTRAALFKYLENQEPKKPHGPTVGELASGAKPERNKARNKKPERSVEKECLAWMRLRGWDVQIFESKATFNPLTMSYSSSAMRAGTPDCLGVDSFGNAVAIEFKAPGKRTAFNADKNYRQREFILRRISMNSFAVCVDSAEILAEFYLEWYRLRTLSLTDEARAYLLSSLPVVRVTSRVNKKDSIF